MTITIYRWTARRKAEVIDQVSNGVLSVAEACRRYQLSVEEFRGWQQAIEAHGVLGLRAKALQRAST